jgi:molecular chaperone GrpE
MTEAGSQNLAGAPAEDGSAGGPVVHDRRRIDPETGKVREDVENRTAEQPAAAAGGPDGGAESVAAVADESARLAQERLADLQRLQAEFLNYKRRVERDRDLARVQAVHSVLEALLPVLDDIHAARQAGDLEGGPFASISEKLEVTLEKFGLARYGEPGETFDPTVHEALVHTQAELAEGTTETTVVQVLQPGYRTEERVLRAARVAVADPVQAGPQSDAEQG